MKNSKKVGLALSGGGFRAAIYHLGTLQKLREMKLLDDVDVISTISGGSITGAMYCLNKGSFEDFEKNITSAVKRNIILGIFLSFRALYLYLFFATIVLVSLWLLYTPYPWSSIIFLVFGIIIFLKFQYIIFPTSKMINAMYSKWFFKGKKLPDLCKKPLLAINATNTESGRQFTFSHDYMGDSFYTYRTKEEEEKGDAKIKFLVKDFPVSLSVASSTCVPFAFSPIYINRKYYEDPKDYDRATPCLIDGGVYDNQGLHKLTHLRSRYQCQVIIVSDAGNKMESVTSYNNLIQLVESTCNIFMNRIKNSQMIQSLYTNNNASTKQVAYISLGWDLEKCLEGFINNLKDGTLPQSVITDHGISEQDIANKQWDKIEEYIKNKIGYKAILDQKLSSEEITLARSVVTQLKPLSDAKIKALVKQAFCMTELQVKLYCPSIVP